MKDALKKIPVVGYLAKWGLDLVKLPIVRQDLHAHIGTVEQEARSAQAEIGALRGQLGAVLDNLSRMAAIEQELGRIPRQAHASNGGANGTGESPAALSTFKQLPEAVRTLKRDYDREKAFVASLRRELDLAGASHAALTVGVTEVQQSQRSAREQVDELRRRLDQALDRLEKIESRTESFERYAKESGPQSANNGADARARFEIVRPEKLAKMAGDLRLNLGCGELPLEGYFNVDARPLDGVDMVGDAVDLPLEPNSVAEIYAAHLIEHFTETDLVERVLPSWRRILKPGGVLRLTTPDAEGMMRAWSSGDMPWSDLRLVTFGGQDYGGNFHYTMFSRESLREMLTNAGFDCRDYTAVGRENGACLEMELVAEKPRQAAAA